MDTLDGTKRPVYQWSTLKAELMWIYEGAVDARSRHAIADHRRGNWAWLIKSGEVSIKWGAGQITALPGQWLISPGEMIEQDFSDDAEILSIHFLCEWQAEHNMFSSPIPIVFESNLYPRLARYGTKLSQIVHQYFPDPALDLTLRPLEYTAYLRFQRALLHWLSEFKNVWTDLDLPLSHVSEEDEKLRKAVQCFNQSPLQNDFPIKEVLKLARLGRAQLDRLFWKAYGVTTRNYWNQLKENAARKQLESSRLSIKEIGYLLGFKHSSHFTTWFQKRLSMTPQKYRFDPRASRFPEMRVKQR